VVLKGREYEKVGSTAALDTAAFSDYVEKVKRWAGEELGIEVSEPNDVAIH
jgi:hypothetical protein